MDWGQFMTSVTKRGYLEQEVNFNPRAEYVGTVVARLKKQSANLRQNAGARRAVAQAPVVDAAMGRGRVAEIADKGTAKDGGAVGGAEANAGGTGNGKSKSRGKKKKGKKR